MKKLKFLLPLFVGIFVAYGCNSVDFGDINRDDDAVTEANTEGLMAGAMNNYFTLAGRNYHTKPNLYVQYQAQNVYTDEQRYNEAPSPWEEYYMDVLNGLKRVVSITSAEEVDDLTLTYGALENQQGVSELFSALVWKRVTDTWGPIPYEEALNDEVLTPSYTDQETIYKDLISRVKAARDMLNANAAGPTGDVIYGGDVTKWKKFANSFLLTLSIQLSNQYPSASGYAATVFNDALTNGAGVIKSVAGEMWYDYANAPGAENPFSVLRGADYSLGEPLVDALKGQADGSTITYSNSNYDARLDIYADDPTLPGRPYGLAKYPDDAGPFSKVSPAMSSAASDLPYMTAAYTYLNRAEAAARGWTAEDAATMLQTGIEMSYATLDAHYDDADPAAGSLQTDGSAFAAQRAADAANVGELQVIAEEKWAALFPMGFASWSEWRRTGIPGLVPSPDPFNDGNIPTRYLYPSTESGVNSENYNTGVNMLVPKEDSNTSKFWWDR